MDNGSPIIVALDGLEREAALKLAEKLKDFVWGFKVNDLFFQYGVKILCELKLIGRVMCDGKFHDIPNTVANTLKKLSDLAEIFTVHASGGGEMITAAAEAAPGKIAAITILTSLTPEVCQSIYGDLPTARVGDFAHKAHTWGATYMVCSGQELDIVSSLPLKKIVPGIRPAWYSTGDDQKRVVTPAMARKKGADLLVIGRPIVKADNPADAAKKTLDEIRQVTS